MSTELSKKLAQRHRERRYARYERERAEDDRYADVRPATRTIGNDTYAVDDHGQRLRALAAAERSDSAYKPRIRYGRQG